VIPGFRAEEARLGANTRFRDDSGCQDSRPTPEIPDVSVGGWRSDVASSGGCGGKSDG
jgi:hypothetical protein